MKKRFTLLILLLLIFSMTIPAFAEGEEGEIMPVEGEVDPVEGEGEVTTQTPEIPAERQLPLLVDNAGLLDEAQRAELLGRLEAISEEYQLEVALVTTPTLEGKSSQDFAHDFFDFNGYGYGENDDGILLALGMAERDAAMSTYGTAIKIFNEARMNVIWEAMMPYLESDQWYEAFIAYVDNVEQILIAEHSINPVGIVIALVIALVVAFIVTHIMKSQLKTVHKQVAAHEYVKPGSLNITRGSESFLYTTVIRTARVEKELAKAAGSSISSSGRSHGGSSRRF